MSSSLLKKPLKRTYLLLTLFLIAMYAPAKDLLTLLQQQFSQANIGIQTISFGNQYPWQATTHTGFVQASESLTEPQQIFVRFSLQNPSATPQIYNKIWLYFEHENGDREYTTDYTLYDPVSRRRLIGSAVEVGPSTSVEVLASYRYIPSFQAREPVSISVSWQGDDVLRSSSCQYKLSTSAMTQTGAECL
ncbi:hypothetical protein FJM67_14635 [Maribrevibacterium harenarium]|uniref:Cutinase n=1 Tax=Maribrevibacterium harenarium TaxID=2589817 RepID=A0A501WJM7_9GAMM|nr:hypothetical protein [Maribrevibacterium harenarium]TPE47337.1 hypothetical protein FJM67_14635 [Maribrevibacterium harenarium]